MRNLGNPFRGVCPRSIFALLLVAVLAATAVISGAATADKAKQKTRAEKPLPPNSAAASAREIVRRFAAVAATDKKIRTKLSAAKVNHKGVIEQEFPLNAVADGNVVYSATVLAKATTRHDGMLISIRLRIDRVDRATGTKTRLLDKYNTYPLAVYARGGRVVIETARILPPPKTKKGASPEFGARTAVYTAAHSDPVLSAKGIATLSIDADTEEPCGSFPLVGGISADGDALVAQVDKECKPKHHTDISNLETELRVWRTDGSRKDLGAVPVSSLLFGPQYLLSGSKLLLPNPYRPAMAVKDVDNGTLGNLWSEESSYRDIAVDGTVALIGLPPATDDVYSGVAYGNAESAAARRDARQSAGSVKSQPPALPSTPFPSEPDKLPFVLFPGGDAENPVMLAPSSASVSAVRFCGSNLYAVDSLAGASQRYEVGGDTEEFELYAGYDFGEFEVQLYDLQGHLVKKLPKTKKLALSGVGCNGDKLILLARRGKGFSATEVGP